MAGSVEIKPKRLREQDKQELADKFNIELRSLKAVLKVESAGSGFSTETGDIKIQFEPYHFHRYTEIRIQNGVDIQKEEYKAYFRALMSKAENSEEAAMLSTSWGLGQVMGFNYKAAGYKTVHEMWSMFIKSEYYQLDGMLSFIRSNKRMYAALKSKDWATFAKYYNGKYYKRFKYDTRLAEAYGQVA